NDDDHVMLESLSIPQAQAAASIVALSGGTMISGDRMSDLDPTRLEILRSVLPSYGHAARPIDLFEKDRPEIFALPLKKSFGEWLVVGLFNADEKNAVEKKVTLDQLRLDSGKTYIAYDFWRQKFRGEVTQALDVHVDPSSVVLLALHEKPSVPRVI